MKIGIVTYYGVANYGAMLQAYAFWKFLEQRGHVVEFIDVLDYRSRRLPLYRCLLSRSMKSMKVKLKNYVQHHITDFAATYPQSRRFVDIADIKTNCPKYDVIIVGSDQVWNPKWCAPNAIPIVFLDFAPEGCKRVAYAASFGVTKWEHKESRGEVCRLLRKFQAISVREISGVKLANELSGRKVEFLIDPTLLWTGDFYHKLISNDAECYRPYVFNYVLYDWTDGALEDACLDCVRKKFGVPTILNDSCEPRGWRAALCWIMNVKDRIDVPIWIQRISAADFVVTNSFHGTVFAILFRRPFVTTLIQGQMAGMNERISTLLRILGLESRMVGDEGEIAGAIASRIDWEDVYHRLSDLRNNADTFFMEDGL